MATRRQNITLDPISIHAPTRGATSTNMRMLWRFSNFNPRSYERSDVTIAVTVSSMWDFNPRSYERSDIKSPNYAVTTEIFQSTLLREERRK